MSSERLRMRVAELGRLDHRRDVFGASAHQYRFFDPFPETELARLEATHGYRLPEDYRELITRVGNGGAGPSYGVLPFRGRDPEDLTRYDRLGAAFAYTARYNPTHLLVDPDEELDDEVEPTEAQELAREARQQRYWEAFASDGALYLCHHGCASRSLLVVSGPCRGEIWSEEIADSGGLTPALAADGRRHTFTSWYEAWLDRAFLEVRGRIGQA